MIGVFNKLANIDVQMLNLKNSLVYTVVLILLLFFFGVFFSVIERINSRAINNVFGRTGLIITGVIGTVVHEFSHMLFCVIFGHQIVDFSLFRPIKSKYDGIMGYVNHRCNINNPYQRIGNFFIGIAPIIFGTLTMIISMWILMPSEFEIVKDTFNKNMVYMSNINNIVDSFNIYVNLVFAIISVLNPFKASNIIAYIIVVYIIYSITTHMDLSVEDLKNSRSGFLLFFLLVFLINFVFLNLGNMFMIEYLKIVITTISFLTVSLSFAIFTMVISLVIEFFFS